MGNCIDCRHYRAARPASDLIKDVLGETDEVINREVNTIRHEEEKQAGNEAQKIRARAIPLVLEWDVKPTTFEFCGYYEDQGIYQITDIKNAGERCNDFDNTPRVPESCATCPYYSQPTGFSDDEETRKALESAALIHDAASQELNRLPLKVSSAKVEELGTLYRTRGIMSSQPRYFAYCKKWFEIKKAYVVCIFANPHQCCRFHPLHQPREHL